MPMGRGPAAHRSLPGASIATKQVTEAHSSLGLGHTSGLRLTRGMSASGYTSSAKSLLETPLVSTLPLAGTRSERIDHERGSQENDGSEGELKALNERLLPGVCAVAGGRQGR